MESLAFLVAVIILSLWGLAALSVLLTFAGFRGAGAAFGVLSAVAGFWLLWIAPQAPLLGIVNLLAGGVSIRRYIEEER